MSEPILTLNVSYNRAHTGGLKFKTAVDGEYTKHEQRNKLWSKPRRSWVMQFEKTQEAYQELEEFIIAVGGRFRAFYWKWRKFDSHGRPAGGDDQMYLVRFDTDDFNPDIDALGGRRISIPIVQVMTDE